MKATHFRLLILNSLTLACVTLTNAAATCVPPPGIVIAEKDRQELRTAADALGGEIAVLRASPAAELLPDVEIFHKAVDWALRYNEFYRSNEVGLARSLIKQGRERARQLREGKPLWLAATGLVARGYFSKIDGSVQPYGLIVPASFSDDRTKAHRLDIWLHGRDNNLTELKFISDRQRSYGEFAPADTFVLHPFGRYCNAFKFAGEVDVFEAMNHVKKSYPIDELRVALRGFSMGGAGVWHLAAHHPDVWAVAAPGAGFSETAAYTKALSKETKPPAWEQKLWQLYDATDYAANFFSLPVVAYNGNDDPQQQAADMMERAMKAEGLTLPRVWGTNVGHKYTPEAKREVSRFIDENIADGKELFPKEVHFTTRTLRYNRAAGLEIMELEKHWQRADVRVLREGNRLNVVTTNVAEISFRRPAESLVPSITIDGQKVNAAATFHKRSGRWTPGTKLRASDLAKRSGLQGPIDDAFMDSFLMVRPTAQPQNANAGAWMMAQLSQATNNWRAQFRGDARVKDDSQVTDEDIAGNNLVLFGDPQSNRLLARMAGKLPIRWNARSVRVGDRQFPASSHVPVFIFPNPLNPKRYVVVNSGFTFAAAGAGSNAQQTPKLPDYAVLDIENGGAVVLADFFNEQWRLK